MHAQGGIRASSEFGQPFRLGDLRIDPLSGEVSGPGGQAKLDPKVMDVLVMLAQRAGQVTLREDLLERLWPRSVVTDDVLSRCIYELRRELGRAGGSDRYRQMFETVPKRGYRLNCEVAIANPAPGGTPAVAPASRPSTGQHWRIAALTVAAAAVILALFAFGRRAEPPSGTHALPAARAAYSVAVLPFVDLSANQDQGYFSDGIAEEILNQLSQSPDLRTISRTSSFLLRDRTLDVPTIAARLEVSHVLEGSVRRSGDDVRITVQLIEASSNSHVWSRTYARTVDNLFDIQDEIAVSVATVLRAKLGGGASKGRVTSSIEAYESFLQGEFYYHRRAPGDVERSVIHLEQAVSIDPLYAGAWAALAGAYSILAWSGADLDEELQRRQGEAARRAVELDPNLAVAHARLSQYFAETSEAGQAREHSRIALALDPDEPLVLARQGSIAFEEGNTEEAVEIQRRLVAQDPLNAVSRMNLAVLLLADERLGESLAEYRNILQISPGAGPDVELEIVRILALQGRYAEARAAALQFPAGRYRDHGLALLFREADHLAEADAALARLSGPQDSAIDSIDDDIMNTVRLAEVQAFRGSKGDALETLEAKMEALAGDRGAASPVLWKLRAEAAYSPFLKPLHADPRWIALMGERA